MVLKLCVAFIVLTVPVEDLITMDSVIALLPIIFKLIANDIPKILNEEDKEYFIKSREDRIKRPLKSLLSEKEKSKNQLFQSLITFEKILANNKFFNGKILGLPDFIFFGNFMWAEKCSSENLFENCL